MHDPVLDRHLANCRKLLEYWQRFHVYLTEAIKGRKFNPQQEADFLKLKSQIAILHDSLMASIEKGNREAAATAQAMITVVENCILLKQIAKMNTPELKRMEIEWHESYLLVNDTIGVLEDKVAKLAEVSQFRHDIGRFTGGVTRGVRDTLRDKRFRFAAVLAAVAFCIIGLPMMGVYSWDFMRDNDYTKPVYVTVRGWMRASIMPELPYSEWEVYEKKGRASMPPGYNPNTQGTNINDQVRASFLKKSHPGLDPLDLTETATSDRVVAERYQRYLKNGQNISIYFLLFKNTSAARETLNQIGDYRRSVTDEMAQASAQESLFMYGRNVNVFWVIWSQEGQSLNYDAAVTLMGGDEEALKEQQQSL